MKTFGLIGKNIDYSFSRNYFEEKFKNENIKNHSYVNFDLENIQQITDVFNQSNSGYNVTIPYKEQIIPYLTKLSPEASVIGAVNTIKIHENGNLEGFNTDFYGFLESLKPHLQPKHKRALVLGTGGASKAVVFALKMLNIETLVVSRNPKNTEISYKDISEEIFTNHLIVINTSPIGTFPNIKSAPAIPYSYFTRNHIAYDLIYNPEETQFLKNAKLQNAKTINGLKMLILQAEKAWEIWNK